MEPHAVAASSNNRNRQEQQLQVPVVNDDEGMGTRRAAARASAGTACDDSSGNVGGSSEEGQNRAGHPVIISEGSGRVGSEAAVGGDSGHGGGGASGGGGSGNSRTGRTGGGGASSSGASGSGTGSILSGVIGYSACGGSSGGGGGSSGGGSSGGGGGFSSGGGLGGGSSSRQGLQALRYQELRASQVVKCEAHQILDGISLAQQMLGQGAYGVVVPGTYHGLRCAVKVIIAERLDKPALRELLLAPAISHANLVQTYTSRCARLTHEFFDHLEGVDRVAVAALEGRRRATIKDDAKPRLLQPIPYQSGDGFGDPGGNVNADPYRVLHWVLWHVQAATGAYAIIIVQELCTKGTLNAAIRHGIFRPSATDPQWNMRLARRALLRTALELARGLLHLHDTGLVHGDVKPANVLLASSRDDRRGFSAKVADFGLVHVLPHSANSVATDNCCGSPAYMAPEAFTGTASRATDVYSFGVCIWELLTSQSPYRDAAAGGATSLIKDLVAGRVPALEWPHGAEMSAGIIALGSRCMRREPAERPSFKDIVQELVDIERGIRAQLLYGGAAPAPAPAPAAVP
ncbi:hypothetical protein HXX76_014278 [Chlamydomonas incerta]|uniref:Protein kinase domain-containing protein n=1 Tax=Chlamydomonas incerta TaxID=51695 RepID=A0A835SCE0_CHLIN|nr:hypothetical protein HXX76_014278 [Chlamydomonas incerta]|eukprot:KAG2424702.1 hypothetical protein HXX76_014278 [Chlamydomonas incerta]